MFLGNCVIAAIIAACSQIQGTLVLRADWLDIVWIGLQMLCRWGFIVSCALHRALDVRGSVVWVEQCGKRCNRRVLRRTGTWWRMDRYWGYCRGGGNGERGLGGVE